MTLSAEQQALAEKYVNLAEGQARTYALQTSRGQMSLEDARSAAMLGLVQGIAAYPDYCQRRGFAPRDDYLRAYLLKRICGAIWDTARQVDHLTRNDRHHVKALRQAEDDGAHGIAQAAAVTGIDPAVARRVQADAAMPVSLDDVVVTAERGQIADEQATAESQHAATEMLAAVVAAMDALPADQQVILALRWHQEIDLPVIAKQLGVSVARVKQLHDAAVTAVHQALLAAVS